MKRFLQFWHKELLILGALALIPLLAVLFAPRRQAEPVVEPTDWDLGTRTLPVLQVEHGADYVIEWQDAGLRHLRVSGTAVYGELSRVQQALPQVTEITCNYDAAMQR